MASLDWHENVIISDFSTPKILSLEADYINDYFYNFVSKAECLLQGLTRIDSMKFTPGARILIAAGDSQDINAYKFDIAFVTDCNLVQRIESAYGTNDQSSIKSFLVELLPDHRVKLFTQTTKISGQKLAYYVLDLDNFLIRNRKIDSNCESQFGEAYCFKCKPGFIHVPDNIGGFCVDENETIDDYIIIDDYAVRNENFNTSIR